MTSRHEGADPATFQSRANDIQAVDRVGAILGLFSNEQTELTVSMISVQTGLNRTTAHRYVTSLVNAGLLTRGEQPASLLPGPLAIQLGAFALGRRTVLAMADRHLKKLSDLFRMSAVLSLWGSAGPVVTAVREDRSGPVLITVPVGTQLSLETAQSVLFLAHMPDQLLATRLRAGLSADGQRDIDELIAQARSDGSIARTFEDGISSVAAPVFGTDGISATIALIHTAAMLPTDAQSLPAKRLRSAAAELSEELGAEVAQASPPEFERLHEATEQQGPSERAAGQGR
jgi:DNA-binding IclR family transcriptional regulator